MALSHTGDGGRKQENTDMQLNYSEKVAIFLIMMLAWPGWLIPTVCAQQAGITELSFDRIYEVGAREAPEEEVFGMYQSIALSQDGRLYVGEQSAKEIRVFDANGKYLKTLGREGEGPGEFRRITSLDLSPRCDSLYVYDFVGVRVTVYETRSFNYVRSFSPENLGAFPYKMYLLDDRVAFVGNRAEDGKLIHLFDLRGNYLESFGELLKITDSRYDTPFMRNQLNQGVATMTLDRDIVVALLSPFRIARYSMTGRLKWKIEENILPNPWDGYIVYAPERYRVSVYPQVVNIYSLDNDYFVVLYYDIEHEKAIYEIRRLDNGSMISRHPFSSTEFIEDLFSENAFSGLAAIKSTEPYPRISVVRWSLRPGKKQD